LISEDLYTQERRQASRMYLHFEGGKQGLMFWKVGSSKRFCLAPKDPGYSHCGVVAHGRTSKFLPKLDAFYVPGGIASGRPTAMMNPYILRENVPRHMLFKFEQS